MSLHFTLAEAAQQYGLGHYSDLTRTATDLIWGNPIEVGQTPITTGLAIGQAREVLTTWSNGFETRTSLMRTGEASFELTSLVLVKRGTGETLWELRGPISISATTLEAELEDTNLFAGADTIYGNSQANTLQGWGGNDRIDGMGGTDTVALSGLRAQYTVNRSGTTTTATGPDGTDTLLNVERLKFSDATLAYDVTGSAGQAYRLYQAAFNRVPDASGLGFQVNALDNGHSLKTVAQNFLNSPEFNRTYGGLSDNAFVTQLYQNVLHRAPDASGLSFQVGALSSGTDRAQLLVNFSESPENQAALVGVITAGVTYI